MPVSLVCCYGCNYVFSVAELQAQGLIVFNPDVPLRYDLQPEFIAMNKRETRAWVTLQVFIFTAILQSTPVISNSKGLSEILRDICTSTYQICRIEDKIIRLTTFNKYICN